MKRTHTTILVISLFLVLILVGGFQFFKKNGNTTKAQQNTVSNIQENTSDTEELVISPQTPTDTVVVDKATLSKNGFVVVRQVDDGKVSQVVEMSKLLKKGVNKDIKISLGGAEVGNKELIVMIYEDYADDGVFNDLDMPALNEKGLTTARFVTTGKPLPSSMTEADMPAMNMPGMKSMAKVRYTDKGFVPDKVEVKAGDMVEFINESSTDMWVASIPHPQHTKLPTFDQFRLYKKGGIFRYVFEKKGTWEYHDHISPSLGGVVVVN